MRFGRVGCGALVLGGALLAGCDAAVDVEVVESDEECVALLPKPPLRPYRADVPVPSADACGEALTDHVGNLYAVQRSTTPGGPGKFHEFLPNSGVHNGEYGTSGVVALAPQFHGYIGLARMGTPSAELVVRRSGELPFGPDVDSLGREGLQAALAPVPDLGALVVASGQVPGVGSVLTAQRWDPFGFDLSGPTTVATGGVPQQHLAGAVNLNASSVAVWDAGGEMRARWLRQDGGMIGLEHALPGVPAGVTPVLRPLLHTPGVALKSAGAWRAQLQSSATVGPPPAWLVATGDSDLAIVRNRTGYAVTPPPGVASPTCTQAVEVRTPTGRLCGRVHLRQGGSACTTAPIRIGKDGSVIERVAGATCSYRVWPGMLR